MFFGNSDRDQPPPPPLADDSGLREKVPAGPRQLAAAAPAHRKRRFLLTGRSPEPLPSHYGTVEPPVEGKLGVCCSGGGIRSAAFSLGGLQALQESGELRKASYLAAVSGGSYIAAAISMVAKTGPDGSDPALIENEPAFARGSPEEQYLRNRCSYLAPTLMDKVYLGLRIVLGLLINLLFVSLPLIGIALVLTGALYAPSLPGLAGDSLLVVDYQANLPALFWWLPLGAVLLAIGIGVLGLLLRVPDERGRFFSTWASRLLLGAGLLAVFFVGVPYLVEWIRDLGEGGDSTSGIVDASAPKLGAGTLALLTGVAAQLGQFLRAKPTEEQLGRARKAFGKLGSGARLALAYAAGAVVGPLLLLSIFAITVAIGMTETARDGSQSVDWALVGAGSAVLALFGLLYAVADLTTWSLHPFYKRRLSSVFALKRIRQRDLTDEERERLEADGSSLRGVALERDYDKSVPLSETALVASDDGPWPTLLVCAAANISDTAATPPGRAVTSFTFSANTVGGPLVGAIRMSELEGTFEGDGQEPAGEESQLKDKLSDAVTARGHRRHDITLPAAMAMSGAAISPSMGKMTARPLRFLMALANVRLGVWVPNPRWVAGDRNPPSRPRPFFLLCELMGWNSVNAKYLYVTDGGHYENLGLVELLRRGCTEVYCLDASGVAGNGAEFGSLGEAIALARTELGVEIEFEAGVEGRDPDELSPEEDGEESLAKRDVVTARIRYPRQPNGEPGLEGTLVYVRNTMTGESPVDVRAHHDEDPRFPNNPTVDQFYTDQKFEAYRVLGARAGANAVEELEALRRAAARA